MKITRNTPDQLIVAHVPWFWGVVLIVFILLFVGIGLSMVAGGDMAGLFFAAIGGGVGAVCFVVIVRRTQVIFDRPGQRLTMRNKSVFGFTERHRPMDGLKRAELETSRGRKSNVYRPVLIFDTGGAETSMPLIQVLSSSGAHARTVREINAWLDAGKTKSSSER